MARKVLKYLDAYRRGLLPPSKSKPVHDDSSSDDDEHVAVQEKFANMRLSPPRTHLKVNRKKAAASKPKISPTNKKHDKLTAKIGALRSRAKVNNIDTEGNLQFPITVYDWIKEAVGIMDRPGWPNGGLDEHHLSCCETRIDVACSYYRHYLPTGWKYERDNARSLIAGYERVINADRCTFIV
ncbi:uncharacterized protein LOC143545254 isoform X2 [Bidens hawaiensis]|uniref:uncharacterized protein LOC143545254 isoform X2 n=1 Tax=Bidens hawaiensis TaxID=980011 RepID=UPI00404A8C13